MLFGHLNFIQTHCTWIHTGFSLPDQTMNRNFFMKIQNNIYLVLTKCQQKKIYKMIFF
jgi:hypothetical protein